jgi:hypothetical protein
LAKDREPQDEPKLFQGLVCLGIWLCPWRKLRNSLTCTPWRLCTSLKTNNYNNQSRNQLNHYLCTYLIIKSRNGGSNKELSHKSCHSWLVQPCRGLPCGTDQQFGTRRSKSKRLEYERLALSNSALDCESEDRAQEYEVGNHPPWFLVVT